MPPKRKGGATGNDEPTSRERKKQKTELARTIAVQPNNTSSTVATAGNAVAGPSRSVRFNSMAGLPGSLDVEKFAEARAYEINAMHEAMKSARSNATKRAWQLLPRHLRRRAASHDVRRVPLRLRDKARAEMDPMRRKALGRSLPKRGKSKAVSRNQQLLKRQRSKNWLETHLWHAKRMKMENMWGYRLAVEPTEKSFRPSHRASVHGSILHDASYYALLQIQGPQSVLRALLDNCCDFQAPSPGAKRFLTGARACETHIYKYGSYPFDLIAPVHVIWQPVVNEKTDKVATQEAPAAASAAPSGGKRKRRGKGKAPAKVTGSADTTGAGLGRTVWIRFHPSVVADVHLALRTASSFALEAFKKSNTDKEVEVVITDLRERVNVLKGALKPTTESKREDFDKFWKSLNGLQTAGSLPRGMVVGCTVYDPRLSFPPKNAKLDTDPHLTSSPASTVFPSSALAQSEIWNESMRIGLQRPRYKKKDIDERKSKNLIPGTPLQAQRQDDRIPVLLIQRSVESSSPISQSDSNHASTSAALHGWTLIIPSGWGMPFLSSLVYTGTRVGGQRECQTQAFEGGCAYFPRDYPSTDAYSEYAEAREETERERWERKPPAKRPNFEKMGTWNPWQADWGVVLGLEEPWARDDGGFLPAQREPAPTAPTQGDMGQKLQPWLMRCAELPSILDKVSTMFNPGAYLLDYVNQVRTKRHQDPLNASIKADELWKSSLVMVRVVLRGRGSPEDLAIIYSMNDEEVRKHKKAEAGGTHRDAISDDDEKEPSELIPSQDSIIGYVTTGHYSLSRGEGHAIGAVPVARLLELKQQEERLRIGSGFLVKIRNRDQTICRAALLEVL
ncbi:POP1-domain-containing protein [Sparassis latifolia]